MEEVQNNNNYYQDDELEIDWMGIISKLLKHWKQIILQFVHHNERFCHGPKLQTWS